MLMVLSPEKAVVINQGQNAMPRDVFRCQNEVSATSVPSAEVRDAAKHPSPFQHTIIHPKMSRMSR